jgi:ankyrin repeat protein
MLAASEGLVNNVRTLILAGADFNGRDLEGKTPWIHALENEHKAVLRLLRSYGVNEDPEPTKEPKR